MKAHLSSEKLLTYQAKSEEKLLKLSNVGIPKRPVRSSSMPTDLSSTKILKMFNPPMLTAYMPASIVGDGNCFFRSVSYAISGSQGHHSLLRLFCSLELIQNRTYYDTKRPNNDFLNDTQIIINSKLLCDAIQLGSYSELAHMYALSAAITAPINL